MTCTTTASSTLPASAWVLGSLGCIAQCASVKCLDLVANVAAQKACGFIRGSGLLARVFMLVHRGSDGGQRLESARQQHLRRFRVRQLQQHVCRAHQH